MAAKRNRLSSHQFPPRLCRCLVLIPLIPRPRRRGRYLAIIQAWMRPTILSSSSKFLETPFLEHGKSEIYSLPAFILSKEIQAPIQILWLVTNHSIFQS